MKLLLLLLVLLVPAFASADERVFPSPGRDYFAVLTTPDARAPSLTIQDSRHRAVFSSDGRGLSEQLFDPDFSPEHVLWSPDGQAVAIAGGSSRFMLTFVFVRQAGSFVHVPVPDVTEGEDNPHVLPVKWLKYRRLVLDVCGPYAGKAINGHYSGKATISVFIRPPACKVLSRHITDQDTPDTS